MFENIFNKKKEEPFLSVGGYKFFFDERKTVEYKEGDSFESIKPLLADIINSPEFYITNDKGEDIIGGDFDKVREIIWNDLGDGDSDEKIRKIKDAFGQNKLSYSRVHQLSAVLNEAEKMKVEVLDLKAKLSRLEEEKTPGSDKNMQYSTMKISEKKDFMKKIDSIAVDLYGRL